MSKQNNRDEGRAGFNGKKSDINARSLQNESDGSEPLTIYPDADPINADWIKVVHWDRILSSAGNLDAFRKELREEGFSPEEFRGLHYFDHLAKDYPWLSEL